MCPGPGPGSVKHYFTGLKGQNQKRQNSVIYFIMFMDKTRYEEDLANIQPSSGIVSSLDWKLNIPCNIYRFRMTNVQTFIFVTGYSPGPGVCQPILYRFWLYYGLVYLINWLPSLSHLQTSRIKRNKINQTLLFALVFYLTSAKLLPVLFVFSSSSLFFCSAEREIFFF